MKISLSKYRLIMQISISISALLFAGAALVLWRSANLQQSIDVRSETVATLAQLEVKDLALRRLMDPWGVEAEKSFEISRAISAMVPEVDISDPVIVGDFRMHHAALHMPEESAEQIFARLAGLQGLPVRVLQIDLSADAYGTVGGTIEVSWLERR